MLALTRKDDTGTGLVDIALRMEGPEVVNNHFELSNEEQVSLHL